jgi:hypothetical protein
LPAVSDPSVPTTIDRNMRLSSFENPVRRPAIITSMGTP